MKDKKREQEKWSSQHTASSQPSSSPSTSSSWSPPPSMSGIGASDSTPGGYSWRCTRSVSQNPPPSTAVTPIPTQPLPTNTTQWKSPAPQCSSTLSKTRAKPVSASKSPCKSSTASPSAPSSPPPSHSSTARSPSNRANPPQAVAAPSSTTYPGCCD